MKPAQVFSDRMVLQCSKPVPVWGETSKEGEVVVELGSKCVSCMPEDGHWCCLLPSLSPGGPYTLNIRQNGECVSFYDVLVGEVWILGGQSNMEFFMRYEKHFAEAAALDEDPLLRMYTCPRIAYPGQKSIPDGESFGYWFSKSDSAFSKFAAIGFWFGRLLREALNVPVGIVSLTWGGTTASTWMPSHLLTGDLAVYAEDYEREIKDKDIESLKALSEAGWAFRSTVGLAQDWAQVMYGIDREAQLRRMERTKNNPTVPVGPFNKNRPGALYETMVKPLSPFASRGVLFYQGENDVHHAELYCELFSRLVGCWREAWHDDLPFLYVQLAPFEKWMGESGINYPTLRRQQEKASHAIPGVWMASSSDVGMRFDIHPKEKKELARRLFLLSMDKVYGKHMLSDAPEIAEVETAADSVILHCRNAGSGLCSSDGDHSLFEVSDENGTIAISGMEVKGDRIILAVDRAPSVVRFDDRPYGAVSIYNPAGLPLKPFCWHKA